MIIRKLLIVALATFCLTATLFMIKPTKSDLGPGEYNPWADVNNDGTVDIYDAIGLSNSFGLTDTGVNSRNVTVTNWPSSQDVNVTNLPQQYRSAVYLTDRTLEFPGGPYAWGWYFEGPWLSVEGYSRMSVFIRVWGFNATPTSNVQFGTNGLYWSNAGVNTQVTDYNSWLPYFNCTYGNATYSGVKIFETLGPTANVGFAAFSPTQSLSFHVTITLYMRNE
jgi:hypothetical protein